jgi:hypothetical protein
MYKPGASFGLRCEWDDARPQIAGTSHTSTKYAYDLLPI